MRRPISPLFPRIGVFTRPVSVLTGDTLVLPEVTALTRVLSFLGVSEADPPFVTRGIKASGPPPSPAKARARSAAPFLQPPQGGQDPGILRASKPGLPCY